MIRVLRAWRWIYSVALAPVLLNIDVQKGIFCIRTRVNSFMMLYEENAVERMQEVDETHNCRGDID